MTRAEQIAAELRGMSVRVRADRDTLHVLKAEAADELDRLTRQMREISAIIGAAE
tara:strand:- start:5319 stop:5483 length:165 start_codon:yes stop_codon:yes gene_type:complete